MKKVLSILVCLFSVGYCFGQTFVPRSGPAVTAQDYRLSGKLNFYVPHIHGFNSGTGFGLNGGLDSLGGLLYDDSSRHLWIRDTITGTHVWTMILKTGDAGNGTVTQVNTGLWILPATITTTGTIAADSAGMAAYFLRRKDSTMLFVTPTQMNSQGFLKTIAGISAGGDLTGAYPNPTIAANAVSFSKFQQLPGFTFLGNPTASAANAQASYFGYGLRWNNDTLKVDTTLLKSVFGSSGGLGGINQLHGDGSAGPGTGDQLFTLSTVNSNVGNFGTASSVASVTINAKGLTTASSNIPIQITEGQVTNLIADLTAKLSSITGYVTAGTNVSIGGSGTLASPYVINSSGGGGGGGTNVNVGAGYRLAIPGTNNIKTEFGSLIILDSTTNVNAITFTADTTSGNQKLSTQGFVTRHGYITLSSLSATSPIGYDNTTGIISEQVATTSQNGYLAATDWTSFNGRLSGAGNIGSLFTTSLSGTTLVFTATTSSAYTVYVNGTAGLAVPSFGKLPILAISPSTANTLIGFDASGNPGNVVVTAIGTSGPATLSGLVLNIPQYSGGGGDSGIIITPASALKKTVVGTTRSLAFSGNWYVVTNYGLVGDSSTDNTVALQNLINTIAALSFGRVVIYIPAGRYLISSHITIPSNVIITWQGAGSSNGAFYASKTKIIMTSGSQDAFIDSSLGSVYRDFDMQNTATTPTASVAIKSVGQLSQYENMYINNFFTGLDIQFNQYTNIHHCFFNDCVQYAIDLSNAANSDAGDASISDCYFTSISHATIAQIHQTNSGGTKIDNCKFNANPSSPFVDCINGDFSTSGNSTSDLLISNSSFENYTGYAVNVSASSSADFSNITITGCNIASYRGGNGVNFASSSGGILHRIAVTGNIFNTLGTAITANGVSKLTISGNTIDSPTTVTNGVSLTAVTNYFYDRDTATSSKRGLLSATGSALLDSAQMFNRVTAFLQNTGGGSPTVYVHDNFNRSNTTDINGSTPSPVAVNTWQQSFTSGASTLGILSNQLYAPSSGVTAYHTGTGLSVNTCDISIIVINSSASGGGAYSALMGAYTDLNNYIGLVITGSTLSTFEVVSGSATSLVVSSTTASNGDTVRLRLLSGVAYIYLNSTLIGSSAYDNVHLTGTDAGVYYNVNTISVLDEFYVQSISGATTLKWAINHDGTLSGDGTISSPLSVISGGSGVTTIGAFSGSSQTNGASISGVTLTFGPADGTNPGMIKASGAQTLGATLTLSNQLSLPAATTGAASLLLTSSAGTNPTSPSSGQLWWNGTNLNFRTGSSTVDLLAGSGAVSSVANSDGTLTISPTTGSVVASLALGHANTWSALQTFGTLTTTGVTKFTGIGSGASTDSVLTINPSTGTVTWRSSAFNLFVANGLTAAAGDSIYWGGTLNQNTSITGAGFTLSEGTSGSPLGAYSLFASNSTLTTAGGNMIYSGTGLVASQTGFVDANITLGSGTNAMVVELGTITANRTLTLSSTTTGQTYVIDNISESSGGSSTFKWTFATTVFDAFNNTITNIPLGRSTIYYNGTAWVLTARPNYVQSGDVIAVTTGQTFNATTIVPYDVQYRVGGYITITAVTGTTISMTVTYTDETNTSRTISLIPVGLTSGVVSTTGVFNLADMTIRAKAGTSISMSTNVTGVSITYDAGCSMSQIN